MKILFYIFLSLVSLACRDNLKIKTYGKTLKEVPVIPEVSSSVEILTDDTGVVRAQSITGASKFGVRILDASCGEEVADLGIQDKPDFALPPSAYSKPLCMETTYFDTANKVMGVKLQPFTFQGPEAIDIAVAKDKQTLDFPDVPDAATYSYILTDLKGQLVSAESNISESALDFQNALPLGTYKVIILALDSQGKISKVMNYKISVKMNPNSDSLSLNLKFEREYYQTRSIKRVLLEDSLLVDGIGLRINDQDLETTAIPSYKGAYGALVSTQDWMMRGLPYGATTAKVVITGVSKNEYNLPVTIKDFPAFQILSASFADGSVKNGLEAWSSHLEQPLVRSGEYSIVTEFGLMIIQ